MLLSLFYLFPALGFGSLVAITAYKQSGQMLNVRDDPKKELPEGITVTLIPAGGCISEWEEAHAERNHRGSVNNDLVLLRGFR